MTSGCLHPSLPNLTASSRTFAGVAIILELALVGPSVAAEPLTPPEAAANLLFSPATTAMPKTVTEGRVTYRGSREPGDPERVVLSVSESRAAPCLFEAFFFELLPPAPRAYSAGFTASYHATIDLRRLNRATFEAAPKPEDGAQFVLAAKDMFCARSIMIDDEQMQDLNYDERCQDTFEDDVSPEHTPRLRAAFEALRQACRW